MRLLSNWRDVLRHAWSVRLMALAVLLEIASQVLPFFEDVVPVSREAFGLIVLALLIAALLARFVNQRTISGS